MADWEEIKRLAADFQRTQTSDTLQRISERNCIDIVKKLTELSLIELIYTCDGKEFLTPSHLTREIEDEIYVNGGRMHLHDLAANLNVDYQHVENRAKELASIRPDEYNLILGQVIHSTYKNTLGKLIHDSMLIHGQLSIAEFAKTLDLPSDFLLTLVQELMSKVTDNFVASQDGRTFYTTDMMDRYKSTIAGTLSAITRPTTVASLMKRLDIPERLFMPIVEGLIKEGRIDAALENRLFIPSVYAREQNDWIDKFYSSNSYIDYDVLSRMDIKQPKAFLKKRFQDGIQLKTCFVSPNLCSQVESLIEDSIASSTWIDICTILPSAIQSDDIEMLIQDVFKKNKQFGSSSLVFNQTIVCSLGFIATCRKSFEKVMQSKADNHLKQGKLVNYFLGGKIKESKSRQNQNRMSESESAQQGADKTKEEKDGAEVEHKQDKEQNKNIEDKKEEGSSQGPVRENKKDKRDKKNKNDDNDQQDSDDEPGNKKSKGKKSGGGSQGREIKQKAVKKKYLPGNKGNQRGNDDSDDEMTTSSKTPRSNKGRAARRAISPERSQSSNAKSKNSQMKEKVPEKEPLIFMNSEEIIDQLKKESRGSDDDTDELFDAIANILEKDLNVAYETYARKTLDEYLRSQVDKENESGKDDDIDMIE